MSGKQRRGLGYKEGKGKGGGASASSASSSFLPSSGAAGSNSSSHTTIPHSTPQPNSTNTQKMNIEDEEKKQMDDGGSSYAEVSGAGDVSVDASPSGTVGAADASEINLEANFLHQYSQYLARQEGTPFNFEQFTQLITTIRSLILSGESSISLPADEESSEATSGIELRSLLHEIRVAFAAEYPLSPTSWLEWIDDVQTIGTGLPSSFGADAAEPASMTDDDDGAAAEAAEARASAAARDEQHFLLSLYRVSLADYFSPAIWNSFLSYVSLTSESLLASNAARIAFRRVYSQALFPRGWKAEQKRRLAERREKKRAKKAAEKEKKKQAEANALLPKNKKQRSAAADDDEEDEENEDAEAESDDDDDEDMGDNEDDSVDESAVQASAFISLHPALNPLLPPFAASTASLSAAIPIANSFDDGYALFQKLHEIEMKILTRMMRSLQKQQQEQSTDEETVTSEEVEDQVDRMSELYRTQLSIPMNDLQYAHQNFKDWQAKQGENAIETDVIAAYEHANKTQQLLQDKYEKHWTALTASNTFQSAVGTLTPEADQLLKSYVGFLSVGQFKKNLAKDPRILFSVFERVLSVAFLDVSWWKQYLQAVSAYAGSHSECMRFRLEVAWRAFRNCPWDAEIVSQLLQVSEELQIESSDDSNVLLTAEIVEGVIRRVLINPALQGNVESNIEVQLQVVDYYRRTVLEKGAANQVYADVVRGYFMSIEHLFPYATTAPASLPSRVFGIWADIEARFLWQFIEDASEMSDEASANAMGQLQQEALSKGVGVSHQAARAIYKRFTNTYGVGETGSPQPWLDWITFEFAQFRAALYSSTSSSSSSSISSPVSSLSQLSNFVHEKFSEAFDQLTDSRFFVAANPDPVTGTVPASALPILTPLQALCEKWLQFERTCSSLSQMQSAQKRVAKVTLAFHQAKAAEALLTQQAAWQQQQQFAAAAPAEAEEEAHTWLSKPKEKAKPAAPAKGKKDGKEKEKAAESKPTAAAEASATTASSDAPTISEKGDSKKKRKREGEEEQQPAKKGKSKESEPSAAAPAQTAAAQAPAEPTPSATEEIIPPHTVFAVNIPWNLAEKDQRALLAPYGEITRLISHRASKTIKLGYVEVTYAKEDACASAAKALEGKELSGKKLHLFREKPTEELIKKAANASVPGSSSATATPAIGPDSTDVDPKSVFVKNLPRDRDDLESLVRKFFEDKLGAGSVASVELVRNETVADHAPAHERFRNFGTVRFVSSESTPVALSMHMSSLLDSLVQIVPDTTPARLKKLEQAKKKQQEAQRKMQPVPRAALTAFQPRATAVKATPKPASSAAAAPAATGAISSNEDFRARLFGKK